MKQGTQSQCSRTAQRYRVGRVVGSNPCPLHWLVGSYPLDHQRRPVYPFLKEDLPLQLSVFFPSDSLLIPLTLTLCSPFANYSFEGHGVSNLETKVTM